MITLEKPHQLHPEAVCKFMLKGIRGHLGIVALPQTAIYGDHMLVVADSSQTKGRFTVGVLVTTLSNAVIWYRRQFAPWDANRAYPGERLSYKECGSWNMQHLQEAHQYLTSIDGCPGLLLSVSSPGLKPLRLTEKADTSTNEFLDAYRDWEPMMFERLLRTGCALAVAMSLFFSNPDRWLVLHDTDELFDPHREEASLMWLNRFVSHVRGEETPFTIVTKAKLMDRRFSEAVLGVADYAAGGLGSGLSVMLDKYGVAEGRDVGEEDDMPPKAAEVSCWFGAQRGRLRKIHVSYGETNDKVFVHQVLLKTRQDPPDSRTR